MTSRLPDQVAAARWYHVLERPHLIARGPGHPRPKLRPRRDVRLRQQLGVRFGMPHVWLVARA